MWYPSTGRLCSHSINLLQFWGNSQHILVVSKEHLRVQILLKSYQERQQRGIHHKTGHTPQIPKSLFLVMWHGVFSWALSTLTFIHCLFLSLLPRTDVNSVLMLSVIRTSWCSWASWRTPFPSKHSLYGTWRKTTVRQGVSPFLLYCNWPKIYFTPAI